MDTLIKIGIAILFLSILGPLIGNVLVFIQRFIFGAVAWIFSLPLKVILFVVILIILLKLFFPR